MADVDPELHDYAVYYTVLGEDGRAVRADLALVAGPTPDDADLLARAAAREGLPPERLVLAAKEAVRPDERAALEFVRLLQARENLHEPELVAGMSLVSLATAILRVVRDLPRVGGPPEAPAGPDAGLDLAPLGDAGDQAVEDALAELEGDDDDALDRAISDAGASPVRSVLLGLARGVGALVGFQPALRNAAVAALTEATRAIAVETRDRNTYPAPPARA